MFNKFQRDLMGSYGFLWAMKRIMCMRWLQLALFEAFFSSKFISFHLSYRIRATSQPESPVPWNAEGRREGGKERIASNVVCGHGCVSRLGEKVPKYTEII